MAETARSCPHIQRRDEIDHELKAPRIIDDPQDGDYCQQRTFDNPPRHKCDQASASSQSCRPFVHRMVLAAVACWFICSIEAALHRLNCDKTTPE